LINPPEKSNLRKIKLYIGKFIFANKTNILVNPKKTIGIPWNIPGIPILLIIN
jgi:hypothetical protein